ncbi:epoxyqueuosine reductase [Alicyclobacillus sacchari]|nr:epoxyqueuosine reductase [Alicyclobacillus sacchari]
MAAALDLPEIGVTDAEPFPELVAPLLAYEERGRTGFEAGDLASRIQPSLLFPEVKSIVVAALPYMTPAGEALARSHPRGEMRGQASGYTYGQDYHGVLRDRLTQLQAAIEDCLGRPVGARVAVDTSPLVDRRVAERSGVGWVGKNGMLYSERYGSYVFLGALLLDIEIADANSYPPAIGRHCGSCERCMTACPTGAIVGPGQLDATRCLSYITQMKGVIPRAYRKKMGRRVWGCDVCQTACPLNRMREAADDPAFHPNPELAYPDLVALLKMSNRQFMRVYGETAMGWRGVRTLQRNALIALGNIGRHDAIAHIEPFLRSDRVELRASAAWALGEIGGPDAVKLLVAAQAVEADEDVRRELEEAVMSIKNRTKEKEA